MSSSNAPNYVGSIFTFSGANIHKDYFLVVSYVEQYDYFIVQDLQTPDTFTFSRKTISKMQKVE